MAVFVLGLALDNTSTLSNLYVTDGINYLDQAVENVAIGDLWKIANEAPTSVLTALFNAFVLSISPLLFPLANSLLLVIAIRGFSHGNAINGLLLFLMLPYFWLSVTLPSKDILSLTLFSVLALRLMQDGKSIGYSEVLLWSAAIFFVRDGFGLVVLSTSSLLFFGRKLRFSPRTLVIVALVSAFGMEFIKEEILPSIDVLDRTAGIAAMSQYSETIAPGSGGLLLRLFGNITNLAFRPVFLDLNGGISSLGVVFFVSGLSLVVAFICFLDKLRKPGSTRDQYIAAYGLINMIALSLSPYVQGRYCLPLVGLVFLMRDVSNRWITKCFCIVAFLSVLAGIAYRQLPDYPPRYDLTAFSLSRVIDWP